MKILTLQFNSFGVNTYIVYDPGTLECAIIDPGMMDARGEEALSEVIERYKLKPECLINTHMHIDHVLGNQYAGKRYNLQLKAHRDDEFLGQRVREQAQMFGLHMNPSVMPVSTYLTDGDVIRIGEGRLCVLHVPGHSPGSIALYDPEDKFVVTGDALFAGSIGRTDLPGGSHPTLIHSVENKLMTLPDDTKVYPGHGPATTIAAEARSNPFLYH